jgi:hypothetical protein
LVAKFIFQDPLATTKALVTTTSRHTSALVEECLTLKQQQQQQQQQQSSAAVNTSGVMIGIDHTLLHELLVHIFSANVPTVCTSYHHLHLLLTSLSSLHSQLDCVNVQILSKLNQLGNMWLMAHFVDLLVKSGILTPFSLPYV